MTFRRSLTALLLFWSVLPGIASAHATPVEYRPASAEILRLPPSDVRIRFSERVEKGSSSIEIYAPDGSRVETGLAQVDAADPRALHVGMRTAGSGTYAVSWSVISADDGHFTRGGFGFSVGKETASADSGSSFQILHRSTFLEALATALELLGQALLLGVIFVTALRGILRGSGEQVEDGHLLRRLRIFPWVAVLSALIGAGLFFWVKLQDLQIAGAGSGTTLLSFAGSLAGRYALMRLAVTGIAAVFLGRALSKPSGFRVRAPAMVIAALLLCADALLRARVSHAAASTTWPLFSILVTAVHLLAKDWWIGGIVVFTLALAPLLRGQRAAARGLAAAARLVIPAFAVGGVTGCYILCLHLKAFQNLRGTHWGMLSLALGILAAVLLACRLAQQLRAVPALLRSEKGAPDAATRENAKSAGVLLAAEAVTGILILFFSSWLIITTPPLSQGPLIRQTAESQGVEIVLGTHPSDDALFLLEFLHADPPVSHPVVTATNETRDIGPIVVELERRSEQTYAFPIQSLSPAGEWKIEVTGERPGSYDAVGSFRLDLPSALDTARAVSETRAFNGFTVFWILAAALLLIAACFLARQSLNLWHRAAVLPPDADATTPLRPDHPLITWLTVGMVLVFLSVQLLDHGHGAFQRACQLNGHYWHESVPIRDGRVTSNVSAIGCMFGMGQGQTHVADAREYAWMLRPRGITATTRLDPPAPAAGEPATLWVSIKDGSGAPVTDLRRDHDRILHVIALGQDLKTFRHVHVEDAGPVTPEMLAKAEFPVKIIFPAAGRYVLNVDFAAGAKTVSQLAYAQVSGKPVQASPDAVPQSVWEEGGYRVTLMGAENLTWGQPARLTFHLEKDGKPILDLEPYLAAPMHIAMFSADLRIAQHWHALLARPWLERFFSPVPPGVHVHQYLPERFGPDLEATLGFPLPGKYVIFGQFKHGGKVRTGRWVVGVG